MSDPFLGEIRMAGFDFAPRGWAMCAGQTLAISQNSALFSLLGVNYGGNGQTTFMLPNLQGRSPVGTGAGIGLAPVVIGQVGGSENVTITTNNMPAHTHVASASGTAPVTGSISIPATTSTAGEGGTPGTTTVLGPASTAGRPISLYSTSAADTSLSPFTVTLQGGAPQIQNSIVGGTQPFAIRNPYLGLTCIIAMEGIFPSRQ